MAISNRTSGSGVSRRRFLGAAVGAIAGTITAALSVPAYGYLVGSSQRRRTKDWVRVLSAESVPVGVPVAATAKILEESGWVTEARELSAFVMTENGTDFVALSDVCTHLGCRVRFEDSGPDGTAGFFCPCHNGVFNKDGGIVSGPMPRPMDPLDLKVVDGEIFVREA